MLTRIVFTAPKSAWWYDQPCTFPLKIPHVNSAYTNFYHKMETNLESFPMSLHLSYFIMVLFYNFLFLFLCLLSFLLFLFVCSFVFVWFSLRILFSMGGLYNSLWCISLSVLMFICKLLCHLSFSSLAWAACASSTVKNITFTEHLFWTVKRDLCSCCVEREAENEN